MTTFCFCGRVGKVQFMGRCPRHAGKEAPKRKEKSQRSRGDSSWAKNESFFKGKIE